MQNKFLIGLLFFLLLRFPVSGQEDSLAYVENLLTQLERSGQIDAYKQTLLTLADVQREKGKFPQALAYYIRAERLLEEINEPLLQAEVLEKIGRLYGDWSLHEKATEYYLQSEKILQAQGKAAKDYLDLLERLGFSYFQSGLYGEAIGVFDRLASHYKRQNDTKNLRKKYKQVADIYKILDRYDEALQYNLELLDLDRIIQEDIQTAATLNNIGFLYKFLDKPEQSLAYFKESLQLYEQLLRQGQAKKDQIALNKILDNIGLLELSLQRPASALSYFEQALTYKQSQNDKVGIAASYNNIAVAHLMLNNYYPAKSYAEQALLIAQKNKAPEIELDSYRQLSRLHEALKQYKQSLTFQKKYVEKREEIFEQKQAELENNYQRLYVGERQEKNMRLIVINREIDNLNFQRLQLEAEQKEKSVEILQKEKRLQEYMIRQKQLERERALQELELARQQLESQKKDGRIQTLDKENQLRQKNLELQEIREQERLKEIELLESKRSLDQLKIEEQQRERQLFLAIGLLLALILILALVGFLQKQRANKKLRQQSEEIQYKNEELASQKEEIEITANQLRSANLAVRQKNEELESQTKRITDSIRYANTIQTAVLPRHEELSEFFPEFFVMYRPKDIVSGDFYWFVHVPKHNYLFVAVVDCTGHGVPGAFMSMIGHTLLSEIVIQMNCYDPAQILLLLDEEIRRGLRQSDDSNRDGMDLGLVRLGGNELVFAGAKRSLYFIPQSTQTLERIKGANRSVGGKERNLHNKSFKNNHRQIAEGDLIYLSTDGYADQCDPHLIKFGSHRLRDLIQSIHHEPLAQQYFLLEQALDKHQQNTEQRDDITLLGLRIGATPGT
ncbi:MAG: DUF2225 domain-containing protein [Bernardetiaceae bacterium]